MERVNDPDRKRGIPSQKKKGRGPISRREQCSCLSSNFGGKRKIPRRAVRAGGNRELSHKGSEIRIFLRIHISYCKKNKN